MRLLPLQALNAIAMLAVALFFGWSDTLPPQAVAHIAFALGALPLILAAFTYFVPVLTRSSTAPFSLQSLPLLTWLGGAVLVAGFSGWVSLAGATHGAVFLATVAVLGMLFWMLQRARRTLGKPHPGFHWYLAALICLLLALLAVSVMSVFPAQRAALRVFHLHLNLLGFIGLTAMGTLQVLMPTAVGRLDPNASQRLVGDLRFAVAGVLLLSIGAAWFTPLAVFGALLYLVAPLRMGWAWVRQFSDHVFSLHGAAVSLACAALGLISLLVLGFAHATGWLTGRASIIGFVVAFLLPLVSGAATQLLPVWLRPGVQGDWHVRLRGALGHWAGLRAVLFMLGGLLLACGAVYGFWLALAGLFVLLLSVLRSLRVLCDV